MHDSFLHPLLRLVVAISIYIYIFPDTVFSNSPMSRFISQSYCTDMELLKYVFRNLLWIFFPRKCMSHLAITTFIVNGYHETWQMDDCSEMISWCSWLGWPLSELQPYVHIWPECRGIHDWVPSTHSLNDRIPYYWPSVMHVFSLLSTRANGSTNILIASDLDAMTPMCRHNNKYDIIIYTC